MAVPFDHIASIDNAVYTKSVIGQLQRRHVWNYIEKIMPQLKGLELLELNCGTGEDAMILGEKGFNLVATDVSTEMLKITHEKTQQYSMQHKVSSQYLNLDSLNETAFDKKFDLIFSNFGGLNCVDPQSLKKFFEKIPSLLSPNGRFIGVVMPKFCWWESLYFLLKRQTSNIFRRWTNKEVMASLQGELVKTWYYNPAAIKRWARPNFKVIRTKPIGLVLPATLLEKMFSKRKGLLIGLNKIEKRLNYVSIYSSLADHYIIDLKLK